jgi:cation diffusion facilitator CzcD-associated flavoprotein CzcO
MPFPADAPTFPTRGHVIAYMTAYAARFGLEPRFGVTVTRIERDAAEGGWRVRSARGDIAARRVVVAAGLNAVPSRPDWPGMEDYRGELLHSSAYRSGKPWAGRRVLVVGAGNSGAEIALDLAEHGARTDLCIRGKLHVTMRETLGLPAPVPTILLTKLPLAFADAIANAALRRTVGDLSRWGIEAPDYGPIRGIVERGRIPLIDVGTLARIKRGDITVRKGIERFHADGITFADGERAAYDAVVLATGFRPGLERLFDDTEGLLDDRGRALDGGITARPGLYLAGYATPPTGTLREIGFIARRIAAHIDKDRKAQKGKSGSDPDLAGRNRSLSRI